MRYYLKTNFYLIITILLSCISIQALAEVDARLERSRIEFGESVRLIIDLSGAQQNGLPDLTSLESDFNVLGTSSSSSIQITNGTQTSSTRYLIELEPLSEGFITIRPIEIENEYTPPLQLTVLPAKQQTNSAGQPDLFIEMEIDDTNPYVQSQVAITTRLFFAVRLLDGSLGDPEADGLIVKRIGEDIQYDTERNHRNYRVIERQYLAFPQQSGSLIIPAVPFQGTTSQSNSTHDLFNSLFQQGKRIRANSNELTLTVRPPAPEFTGSRWLPAQSLTFNDELDLNQQFIEGDAYTRILTLQAIGLTGEQLPEITIDSSSDYKSYPDKPIVKSSTDGTNMIASKTLSVAIIPTQDGEITLPKLEIRWWNTVTDEEEVAVLPEQTISVLPISNSNSEKPITEITTDLTQSVQSTDESATVATELTSETQSEQSSQFWKYLSLFLFCGWILTLIVLLRINNSVRDHTKQIHIKRSPKPAPSLDALKQACKLNQSTQAKKALLDWGAAVWPANPPQSLSQLSQNLKSSDLVDALHGLDKALYSQQSDDWSGQNLWEIAKQYLKPPVMNYTQGNTHNLPPLYPSE